VATARPCSSRNRRSTTATARERVVERYSLARNIDRLLELYAEVLG